MMVTSVKLHQVTVIYCLGFREMVYYIQTKRKRL